MSHVPNELAELMPEQAEAIAAKKTGDAHFAKLAEAYHELNRAIHRAETDVEPTDDFNMQDMRRKRLALLDEIKGMLAD
ncbi:MAG: YdcH family protein [Pseudomonadota bacterium]